VEIYTDGACSGNPGPGGLGVMLRAGQRQKEIALGYRKTTNNRMELMAAIKGLEALKERCSVTLYSDSRYLVDAIEQRWVYAWQAKQWRKKENPDLWRRLLALLEEHEVKLTWVKGHADNPWNNRCDELAVEAMKNEKLLVDEGYEEELRRRSSQGSLF